MRSLRRVVLPLAVAAIFGFALAQAPQVPVEGAEDTRLPSGKSQRDEILKSEHEQNIKDAGRLAELADELKQALEKEDRFVLGVRYQTGTGALGAGTRASARYSA